jgi:hypothetical protein
MRTSWVAVSAALFCWLSIAAHSEEPLKVTVCQLRQNPAAFNHKLVQVESFVSHDFEDFSLFDPSCHSEQGIWLEYGGKAKSDTMYCCGPTAGKERPQALIVEDIAIPLVDNAQFRQFDSEIQPPFRSGRYGSVVHAVLIGRFFAGRNEQFPGGKSYWGGYGHMGCCSLLAIQEVKSVSLQDRDDLDYGASAEQPTISKVGCGFTFLPPISGGKGWIDAQKQAEDDPSSTAFDRPEKVGSDFLVSLLKLNPPGILNLEEKKSNKARVIYEWRQAGKNETYMLVIVRPYWLSYYAKDPNRVAWTVIAAYASSCRGNKSVTRLK